jgi:hypothetical protein
MNIIEDPIYQKIKESLLTIMSENDKTYNETESNDWLDRGILNIQEECMTGFLKEVWEEEGDEKEDINRFIIANFLLQIEDEFNELYNYNEELYINKFID